MKSLSLLLAAAFLAAATTAFAQGGGVVIDGTSGEVVDALVQGYAKTAPVKTLRLKVDGKIVEIDVTGSILEVRVDGKKSKTKDYTKAKKEYTTYFLQKDGSPVVEAKPKAWSTSQWATLKDDSGAYLGVVVEPPSASLRSQFNLDSHGLVIAQVTPKSPAAKAKLKAHDILISVDDKPIKKHADLKAVISGKKPGERVNLHVLRKGDHLIVETPLARRYDVVQHGVKANPPVALGWGAGGPVRGSVKLPDPGQAEKAKIFYEWVQNQGGDTKLRYIDATQAQPIVTRLRDVESKSKASISQRLDRIEEKLDALLKRLSDR